MSRIRRIFEKDLKAKVVLEALKKRYHHGISKKKYELLPNPISTWSQRP
jgi:hypothetical protein